MTNDPLQNKVNDCGNTGQTGGFTAALAQALRVKDFQTIVQTVIQNASSVLDIGCGIGDYLKYTTPAQRVVGLEPHAPYIAKAREVAPWVEYVNSDALTFLSQNEEQFDCILMIDVVEHLEQPAAIKMMQLAKNFARQMIFCQLPIGVHEQSQDIWNLGGDYWQTHRSTWDETNVDLLGFSNLIIWRDWYDWDEPGKSRDMAVGFWSHHPKVSVVVPTYNQAEWLPKTLDSIIAQSYPFWEAVVVNDGSTDATPAVLADYAKREGRIRVIHKPNGGISSALNTGIQNATGRYFCWLSSDDLFYPNKLELQLATYARLDESYAIVFGAFDLIDQDDKVEELPVEKPFWEGYEFPRFLKYDYIDGCTVMIPLPLLKEIGGFNLQYKHAQDTELWFRLAALGYRFFFIPTKLTLRRVHPQQGFSDFGIDCRYDGYAMIHFYLTNYPFREFFDKVNFNKKEERWRFIKFIYELLSNSDHLVNHPTLHAAFWRWFKEGMLWLPPHIRAEIIMAGITAFDKAKAGGPWWQYVLKALRQVYLEVNNKPAVKVPRLDRAQKRITDFDRASDEEFWKQVYQWGKNREEEGDYQMAFYAFKYLADRENPYYWQAYTDFIELTNHLSYYDKFVRSFRRKPPITTFPDKIKAYYVWSVLQSQPDIPTAVEIAATIQDETLRTRVEHWIAKDESTFVESTNIRHWNYAVDQSVKPSENRDGKIWETTIVWQGVIEKIELACPSCGKLHLYSFTWPLASTPNSKEYFCPDCMLNYTIRETVFLDYFLGKIQPGKATTIESGVDKHVYFVLRYTNIVGGGVKKVFQFMEWLDQLGCKLTIYSDADPPVGKKLPGVFIKVKDHHEDEFDNPDLVVVFSIYDVPKILDKVPIERIVHLCQGYEGYHIGRNYADMRRDKYFYTALHSIPVKNLLVSKHLMDLFQTKFNRTGYYVPNGIDLAVFHPKPAVQKIANSILFIGNPYDLLKGFQFLIDTLAELQQGPHQFKPLHLLVITNIVNDALPTTLAEAPQLQIHWQANLTSEQVAEYIRRVNLVVVTSIYEGFSLPALEAMACGTPVITTNNLGAESFCEHAKNSLIVPFGDKKLFAQYIYEILAGKREIDQLVSNGFQTAAEYDLANSVQHFLTAFETLLATRFDEQQKHQLLARYSEPKAKYADLCRAVLQQTQSSHPVVSIVILTYNCLDYTRKCLDSIRQYTTYPYELVIVDNGSTDGTPAFLQSIQQHNPHVQLILNPTNRGFAAGNNQAVKVARGKYVLFLNNDVLVSAGWLNNLVRALEKHPRIGAVGPMTNHISGRQAYARIPYKDNDEEGFHTFAHQVSQAAREVITPRYRLAGFALLMPKVLFDELGGFDESFGTGNFEDDDLCLRIRSRGYRLFVAEGVYVHHYGSQTFKANRIDYVDSIKERLKIFQQKWPQVDYQRLFEIEKSLVEELEEYKRQARQAIQQKDYQSAIQQLTAVVAENPLDHQAALLLAECYQYNHQSDLALRQLKELLRRQPPLPEAFALTATIVSLQRNWATAEKLWQQAINLKPTEPDYYLNYAEILLAQGKLAEAVHQYEQLCNLQPQNLAFLLKLGELYCQQGKLEQVKVVSEKAQQLGATPEQLQVLQKHFQSAMRLTDSQLWDLSAQATRALEIGEIETARSGFRQVLQIDPQSEDALLGMALCSLHQNDFASIEEYLVKLKTRYPENPMGWYLSGVLAFREDNFQQAKQFFETAMQKAPALTEAQRAYAETLYQLHQLTASRQAYQQLLEQKPDDVAIMSRIGQIALEEEEREVARGMFRRILQLEPQNEEVRQLLANIERVES